MPLGGEIDPPALKGAIGALFGIAILVATARTIIRFRKFGRFFIDDYFFFLGVATLITGTGILYVVIPAQYAVIAAGARGGPPLSPEFLNKLAASGVIAAAGATITWITIFCVKFSFLFFFRNLVRRLKMLTMWWWFTLAIMIPVAITDITAIFLGCPHPSSEACLAFDVQQRQVMILNYTIASDVLTDAMLISIPVLLLWQSQLKLGQKLGLGATLCLSVFMIIIAAIRGATARVINGAVDTTWETFWIQTEACVGIIMVSMTAVRTLFVPDASKKTPPHSPRQQMGDSRRQSVWKKNLRWGSTPSNREPVILIEKSPSVWRTKVSGGLLPSFHGGATMTGMRTMIRENGRTTHGSFGSEDTMLPALGEKEEMEVRSTLSGSTLRGVREGSNVETAA